jgi:hypothetical protein
MTVIRTPPPRTFYEQPDRASVEKLLAIVERAHPKLAGQTTVDELNRSLWAIGHMFRLAVPSKRFPVSHFIDEGVALLNAHGWSGASGAAFYVAVLASGDVPHRSANPRSGPTSGSCAGRLEVGGRGPGGPRDRAGSMNLTHPPTDFQGCRSSDLRR